MTVRIGFVGAGRAADKHFDAVAGDPRAVLVGFAEPMAERRAAREREWGVSGHADLAALARQGVDALVVMVPPAATVPAMEAAVAVAPTILLEKPMATTLARADEVAAIAKRGGAKVLMGHNGLHHPGFIAAREAIAGGAIGTVTGGTAEGSGWLPLPERDFRRRVDLTGGGVWMDVGSHLLYSLSAMMGEIVEAKGILAHLARSDMEGDDHAVVALRFASGALASVEASYARKRPGWAADWPEGMFVEVTYWGTKGAVRYRLCPSVSIEISDGDGRAGSTWRKLSEPTTFQASFDRQMAHFIDVALGEALPRVTLADGRAVLETLIAVQEGNISADPS